MTGQFGNCYSPTSTLQKGIAIVLSIPVIGFSGLMIFIGLRSMTAQRDLDDLSICFWAGMAVLAAWGLFLYYQHWLTPRRTIHSFALADGQFTCTTRRDGTRTYPLADLKFVAVLAGKRKIYGWLIRFDGSKHLQINCELPNAEQLASELMSQVKAKRM